ncbi:hypothetical protein BGZ51_007543 [Haplosporangium sp. Z 767]|nr:hypothetical protein BGZ50_007550 [Haplosporangium sp. Z 11]KAF9178715.1 hypothetical protein BGZ51_007543 [Haplosporangium sp. Z 767]
MQRSNDHPSDNLHGYNLHSNVNQPSTENDNNISGNKNYNDSNVNRNATSSYTAQQPNAMAMRSGLQNPSGSNYQVAEPSMGGGISMKMSPYDSAKIEVAKEHLVEALNSTHINDKTKDTETTGTNTGTGTGTTRLNNSGVDNDTRTNPALAGVTTAGTAAAGVGAAKTLASQNDQRYTTAPTAAENPMTAETSKDNTMSAPRSTGHIEPRHSTGLDRDSVERTEATHHHHHHQPQQQQHQQQMQGVHDEHLPASMRGHQVHTAGVMGASSPWFPAPPMNDTVVCTTDIPPTAPGQATSASNTTTSTSRAKARRSSHDSLPKSSSHKSEDDHHHHHGIAEKVMNVFRRRSTSDELEKERTKASTTTPATTTATTAGTSGPSENTKTAAAMGVAAAGGVGARGANRDVNQSTHNEPAPGSPHLTSSGAPKADLHATSGVPAPKVDVKPTKTLNQGYNNQKPHQGLEASSTKETSSPTSTTDKIKAPILGAAATAGVAAMGAAANAEYKARSAKDSAWDKLHGNNTAATHNNDNVHESGYKTTASSAATPPSLAHSKTQSSASSGATLDTTKSIYTPSVNSTANKSSTSTPGTIPSGPGTGLDKTAVTDADPGHGTTSTAPHHNPLASYIGQKAAAVRESVSHVAHRRSSATPSDTPNKVSDAKDPVVGTSHNTATPSAYQKPTHSTAPGTAMPPPTTTAAGNTASRPLTDKAAAPLGAAAAAGTAAYAGHKAATANDTPSTNTNDNINIHRDRDRDTDNRHNTSAYPTTTTPTAMHTGTTTAPAKVPMSTAAGFAPTADMTAPTAAPTSTAKHTTSNANEGSIGASAVPSSDRTSAPVPSTYQAPILQAGPGEKVAWVKTVTTTDYYGDKAAAAAGDGGNGGEMKTHDGGNTGDRAVRPTHQKVYNNNDNNSHEQDLQRGGGHRM